MMDAETCPPCNHDCQQSDTCPARNAPQPAAAPGGSFDPIPEFLDGERVTYWIAIGLATACTVAVAAGAMGYAYSKWVA